MPPENRKDRQNPDMSYFTNPMVDMQRKWAEAFSNISNMFGGSDGGSQPMNPFATAKLWQDNMKHFVDQGLSAAGSAPRGATGIFEQLQKASNAYASLLGLWSSIPSYQASFDPANARGMGPFPADYLKGFVENILHWSPVANPPGAAASEAWQNAAGSLATNWAKFVTEMSRRATEGLRTEDSKTDAVRDFYLSWLREYEATLGRFVNMPAVGPARYDVEKMERWADATIKYQAANLDFNGKLVQTGVEALQEVLVEAQDIFSGDVSEETFDKFYQLLMNVGERRYHELFKTPSFLQSLESLVITGLDSHKAWSDLTEECLRSTPIVTQSQADEIHREVYLLKKRISDLERRLSEKE